MKSNINISPNLIVAAYSILFQDNPGTAAIASLTIPVLKKAYRKSIFMNHPDRARLLGEDESFLEERSKLITDSYRILTAHVRHNRIKIMASPAGNGSAARNRAYPGWGPGEPINESFFKSFKRFDIPQVPLKLGQYLFYLGIVDFMTLLRAIQWQQMHSPGFGQVAREMRIINFEDTHRICRSTLPGERFGECAHRLGIMTAAEIEAVAQAQAAKKRRIGEYFIARKIITHTELMLVLDRLQAHNMLSSS